MKADNFSNAYIASSWREISLKSIRNCFREVKIFTAEVTYLHVTEIDISQEITAGVKKNLIGGSSVTQEEFCNCDKEVVMSEFRYVQEIYDDVKAENRIISDNENNLIDESEKESL